MIAACSLGPSQQRPTWRCMSTLIIAVLALCSRGGLAQAQTFTSGSNGSDGALTLTTPGSVDFNPGALGLDPDGDHVYHFTTITIGAGVTVRLSAAQVNGPVFWLASGAVQIDGTIDLNGQAGLDGSIARFPSLPGAGGFAGGVGGTAISGSTPGNGPGGGPGDHQGSAGSSGAGHATQGGNNGGPAYGNNFLVPLVGGSGAGGGAFGGGSGGGGGAGGGAILIASSTVITVNGSILANGGIGGFNSAIDGGFAGSASGGAIHLLAPTVNLAGTLSAVGGAANPSRNSGSHGRIRVESFQRTVTGSANPLPIFATLFGLFLPPHPPPLVRVVSVAGVPVPPNPTGSFTMPDVTINNAAPVTIAIAARSIPPGTVVQLHLFSDTGADQIVNSTPLAGTLQQASATATVSIPSGFSRGFVRATWTP